MKDTNKHTHSNEIIRWAGCEDDTVVWFQLRNDHKWTQTRNPAFHSDCKYVVNDEFANERMYFVDGGKIQKKVLWSDGCPAHWSREWHDYDPDDSNNIDGSHNGTKTIYRIKPKAVYKYQMLYRAHENGPYMLTGIFYESEKNFLCAVSMDEQSNLVDVERLELSKTMFNNE